MYYITKDLHILTGIISTSMRTSFIISWFLLTSIISVSRSQEKQLFGFGDLDWGSSQATVKEYMKNKFDMEPGYERGDAIGYQGGHIFKQDMFLWVYFFNHKGLTETDLVIKSSGRPLGGIFSETVHELTLDYGDPDLYKPDDWNAEWFFYDFPGKHLKAVIKVLPYSDDKISSIKISFLKSNDSE